MNDARISTKDKTRFKIYKKEEFGEVRTVVVNGEPKFCLTDVCKALEIKNATDVAKRLDTDELTRLNLGGQSGETNFINESGLYAVILRSDKSKAKDFRKWVTGEVLPTIRKTGGYVNSDDLFIETYLKHADENTKTMFRQTLGTIRQQNEIIEEQKKEISHKEDVIIGLVKDIDLATKRQRIVQIVRHCSKSNYQERFTLLYSEFEKKYHIDLNRRMASSTLKPKAKNKMDYIDRELEMIPQLYEVACKLFENDVEELKAEWDRIIT